MLSREKLKKIVDTGTMLMTEKDKERLLDLLINQVMEITACDAATLYLWRDEGLMFARMKTRSLHISRGEGGEHIDLPPVSFDEKNVCAYAAMHRELINVADVYESGGFDFSGPKEYDALTGYRTQSMLVIPLEDTRGDVIGVLQLMNAMDADGTVAPFHKDDEYVIRALGSQTAVSVNNMLYMDELKDQLYSFVSAFVTSVDARTPYNGSHTRKVAVYAGLIADWINRMHKAGDCEDYFDENRREQLVLAAALHDIGKMVIPLSVMNKATKLGGRLRDIEKRFQLLAAYGEIDMLRGQMTEEENGYLQTYLVDSLDFLREVDRAGYLTEEQLARVREIAAKTYRRGDEIIPYLTRDEEECLLVRRGTLTDAERERMESHVVMTEKILDQVHFGRHYANVARFAVAHHELLDGSGYPRHKKADELELEMRILAVADIYDALVATDRPYKKPLPQEKAFSILYSMVEEGKLDGRLVTYLEDALYEISDEELAKRQMF